MDKDRIIRRGIFAALLSVDCPQPFQHLYDFVSGYCRKESPTKDEVQTQLDLIHLTGVIHLYNMKWMLS